MSLRLFVGIELAGPAREAILGIRERLVEVLSRQGVRFVRPEKLHITLAFLGQVDESAVEPLEAALDRLGDARGHTMTTSDLGCFPDMRRPKVIWIGLEGDTSRLVELARCVTEAARPFAPEMDEKPFSAHLTLARINPGSREVGRVLQRIEVSPGRAELPVASFILFLSRPDGTYEALHEVRLSSS